MKRNIIETVLGAVVLVVTAGFVIYGSTATEAGSVKGYPVTVNFNEIGGLKQGDDVRLGGVKVGSVDSINLDSATYQARVTLSIDNDIKLPEDSAARVSSESIMGGNYLALDPGGDDTMIKSGGQIRFAQDAQNLETLLGKFIFSMSESKDGDKGADASAAPAAKAAPAASGSALPQM